MIFDIWNPLFSLGVFVVSQSCRPASLDEICGAFSLGDNFVRESAGFTEHNEIQLLGKVVMVDDGVVLGVRGLQSN